MTPAVLLAVGLLGAAAVGIAPRARPLARALAVVGLCAPWLLPHEEVLGRAVAAFVPAVVLMKVFDVAADRSGLTAGERLLHLVAMYDVRRTPRVRPGLDLRGVAVGAAWCAWCGVAFWIASPAGPAELPLTARYAAALVGVYGMLEVSDGLGRGALRLVGLTAQRTQNRPHRSRSLGEFWGRRWNGLVRDWLGRHVFRPAARRGHPALGVLAAFAVSGAIHAYPVLVTLGPAWASCMLGFFGVHGALTIGERKVGLDRLPEAAGRGWTVAVFVVTGPLFVAPVLRLWDAIPA